MRVPFTNKDIGSGVHSGDLGVRHQAELLT